MVTGAITVAWAVSIGLYLHGPVHRCHRWRPRLSRLPSNDWAMQPVSKRSQKVIDRGISLKPTVLLVLSKHAIESDWVEFEVDKAVEYSKEHSRDVLCPVALDAAWLERTRMSGQLRTQIKKYVVLDFSRWMDERMFAAQFRKLFDGLGLHYANEFGKASDIVPA